MVSELDDLPSVELEPDRDVITIWGDDGPIRLKPADAQVLSVMLAQKHQELADRPEPPAPRPWYWGGHTDKAKKTAKPFAECDMSVSSLEKGCTPSITVGDHEFYLDDMVGLRDWLTKAIKYMNDNYKPKEADSGSTTTEHTDNIGPVTQDEPATDNWSERRLGEISNDTTH